MQILRDLWRLIRSWWQVDRIRISPTEGRMWRLDPPCVVFIDGTPVEVRRKLPVAKDSQPAAEYECLRDGRETCLRVTLCAVTGKTKLVWGESEQVEFCPKSSC